MPTLSSIATVLQEYRRQGRSGFAELHANPFLLVRLPAESTGEELWGGGFKTDIVTAKPGGIPVTWSPEELAAAAKAEGLQVLEICKSADNPWRGRISLGRARNNDMVINHGGISKLHARFTVEKNGMIHLADAGSHNGTKLNGVSLAEGEAVSLSPGDRLEFGDLPAVFHTPESLCDFLDSLFD